MDMKYVEKYRWTRGHIIDQIYRRRAGRVKV